SKATMNSATQAQQPVQLSHKQILIVFGALMTGMLLSALDQTIVSTALPTIVGELGGLEHLSWVITAYLLASTTSVPLYGKLSDLYGRKLLFQFGIAVFVIGSLFSGTAQNMESLILFRGIQGLGAGGIMAISQAIIGDILSPRERGRYQGYMGGVFAFASVAGPLIGGFFTDQLTWRWVFFINIPLGIFAFAITGIVLKLPRRHIQHKIDYLGSALMVGGVSCLLLVMTWGGTQYAWTSLTIEALTVAAVAQLALFVWWEMRFEEPLLPPRLFKDPVFRVSSAIGMVLGVAMFGAIAFMPVYMQVVKGASATGSGLRMLPMMLGVVTSSTLSGRYISQTGRYRIFPIAGCGLVLAAIILLSRLGAHTPFALVSFDLLVLGVGLGMVMQIIVLVVQNSVEHRDMGIATAGVNFFRSMGGAFGVAIFGSVLANRLNVNIKHLVDPAALNGISIQALTSSPAQIRALPAEVHAGVVEAFARSLETVFLVALPIALVAFVLSLMLKEVPLRDQIHVGAVDTEGALPPSASEEAEAAGYEPDAPQPNAHEPQRPHGAPIGVGEAD
ncbi:MAG TPA: MDR family MFS transporter, partial [Dehalococcoidia bacterium]